MESNFEIQYPQTLDDMWHYAHGSKSCAMTEKQCGQAWSALQQTLVGYAVNQKLTRSPEDGVLDYITNLLTGNGPLNMASYKHLIRDFRKFLVAESDPVSKELSDIQHEALLALEKAGKIKRDNESQGKNISRMTFFALTDYRGSEHDVAVFEDYKKNADSVPCYFVKIRGGNAEKTQLLSPQNAQDLILRLLNAFGKWTRTDDLLKAMKKHVPDQYQEVKVTDKDGNDMLENISDSDHAFPLDELEEFYTEQADLKAAQLSESVWAGIKKVSTEVFCLYYLPVTWFAKKVSMKKVGATSTIGDQNKKIEKVVQKELAGLMRDFKEFGMLDAACRRVLQIIPKILKGRCTENKYNPDLLCEDTTERNS